MFYSGNFSQALLSFVTWQHPSFLSCDLFFALPLLLQTYILPVCTNRGRPLGVNWLPEVSCKLPVSWFCDVSQCRVCLPKALFNLRSNSAPSPLMANMERAFPGKIFLLTFKTFNWLPLSYLQDLIFCIFLKKTQRSQIAGLHVVPKSRIPKSRLGERAFSYQEPVPWSERQTQLKTFLFSKAHT